MMRGVNCFIESNCLHAVLGSSCNNYRILYETRILYDPLQGLHTSHTPTDDGMQFISS